MKTCSACKEKKIDEAFNWKIKSAGKRSSMCKECHKNYRRQHYLDNRQKYIDKARRWESINGKSYSKTQIYIYEYLLRSKCDCGQKDPACLDFDHIDPTLKSFNVSSAARDSRSLEEVVVEIGKCIVRCKNCHAKRTAQQYNWYTWYDTLDERFKNVHLI